LKQTDLPDLMNRFLTMHVKYDSLNNKLSKRILDNFVKSLDYGKYYFYKKDITGFSKHELLIDDYLNSGRYSFINEIFNIYKQRFNDNMKRFDKLIKRKYNFSQDETIIIDRDKVDYAINEKGMNERWRKSIKLQLLNYISGGKKIKGAKEKLKKKYSLLRKRINEITREKLLSKLMNAFSTALDPHSNYLTQGDNEDFQISMKLKLEGIGVRLRSEDGFVIVESIIPGGATDKLPKAIRLKPNDKIVAVGQKDGEPIDVIDMDLRDVVKQIRGNKGTEVRLTIIRETEDSNKPKRMIVPIIREEIKLKDSDAESDIYKIKANYKIGYIKLPSFYQDPDRGKSSAGDIKLHLNKLKKTGVKAIVLDLRGNPGGLLNEAIKIAALLIGKGPVVQIKDAKNPPQVIPHSGSGFYTDEDLFYKGPIVVLINKFSASASEILAGAIKDYNRGLIIGPSNTYGKGTVQSYNELSFKRGAIKVTTHIFYQPGGTSNQLNGIIPNIKIPDISAIWNIGEGKTTYPLKWKKIKKAKFKKFKKVNSRIVNLLKSKSSVRISNDKNFRNLIRKIEKFKKQLSNKKISLKEESNIDKQKKKVFEKHMRNDRNKKIINLKNDIFLKEAFHITGDYIKLLQSAGIY
ncbi:carboxy terminal-processing peptidase, partial [Spirochaetota bacterium]